MKVAIDFYGADELKAVLEEIEADFGVKDRRRILINGVRDAMRPVLSTARFMVPVDTGALRESLQVEARRPTAKDRRSKYITSTDAVIAAVTTAPGKKLAKKKFYNRRTKQQQVGIESDARAMSVEFGTANRAATPYLRPALESQSNTVVTVLSSHLRNALEKYKARQAKKGTR